MAVKIMPTCIPLTARICDAPARENSFFVLDSKPDLSAMQSALHNAEVSESKCVVKIFENSEFVFWASFSITLESCFVGFSI